MSYILNYYEEVIKYFIGKNNLRDSKEKYQSVEVDFVAKNKDKTIYIQVAKSVLSPETLQRELTALKKINNHYPKLIFSSNYGTFDYNEIK